MWLWWLSYLALLASALLNWAPLLAFYCTGLCWSLLGYVSLSENKFRFISVQFLLIQSTASVYEHLALILNPLMQVT